MLSILDVAECWNSIIHLGTVYSPYVDDSYLTAFITCMIYISRGYHFFGAHFVHMHIIKRHTSHVGLYSRVPITIRLLVTIRFLGTFSAYEVLRCSYLRLHNLGNHNELIHSCFCLLVKT